MSIVAAKGSPAGARLFGAGRFLFLLEQPSVTHSLCAVPTQTALVSLRDATGLCIAGTLLLLRSEPSTDVEGPTP